MTVPTARREVVPTGRPDLLDVAVEVLVADPSASLATVAAAAGIGRTTLHKQYATRDALLTAIAHRALERTDRAIATADPSRPGALRRLVQALIPAGPQLAFLFRQPGLGADPHIGEQLRSLERPIEAVIESAQRDRTLRSDRPLWWFVSTLYALVYIAWEGIEMGRLAPLDATDLVLGTLTHGLGVPGAEPGTTDDGPGASGAARGPEGAGS